jgi:polyisoprenoid-binding protein YceI
MAWNIDKSHSEVGFAVRHMMISTVRGKFSRFDADISVDPANLEAATVTARIDARSIDTGEEKRDGHLRSPDFFDVEKYPTLTFTSTRVKRDGNDLEVTGNL